jgi:hypothetical protein
MIIHHCVGKLFFVIVCVFCHCSRSHRCYQSISGHRLATPLTANHVDDVGVILTKFFARILPTVILNYFDWILCMLLLGVSSVHKII